MLIVWRFAYETPNVRVEQRGWYPRAQLAGGPVEREVVHYGQRYGADF
ncbi:MAG: hypothetical protein GTO41_06340 [Burkholderiales bacterium]|nr:hypothetical protein [Burkholderiales bacterium]